MTTKAHRDRMFFLRKGWGKDGWSPPPCLYMTKAIEKQVSALLKLGMLEEDADYTGLYRITDLGKIAIEEHFA